jgi:hypothetical protein
VVSHPSLSLSVVRESKKPAHPMVIEEADSSHLLPTMGISTCEWPIVLYWAGSTKDWLGPTHYRKDRALTGLYPIYRKGNRFMLLEARIDSPIHLSHYRRRGKGGAPGFYQADYPVDLS